MSYQIVEKALSLSKADAAIVIAEQNSAVNLRWANNTLTTNGATRSYSVTVISIIGRKFGVRSANSVDEIQLETLVRASEADAKDAADSNDYNDLITGESSSNWDAPVEHTDTDRLQTFAKELGTVLKNARSSNYSLFGFAEHKLTTAWIGTSSGLRLRHTEPIGSVQWNAKGTAAGASVWHGESTRDFSDVDIAGTDEMLRKRISWCKKSYDLPAERYETIVPPTAVGDMMVYAYWSAAGRDAADGRTVFSSPTGGTRIGDQLGPNSLNLYSDPFDATLGTWPFVVTTSSYSAASVFDNGLPVQRTDWIKQGALTNLIQTRATAAEQSVPVTPFIENLILEGEGTATIDDMVASTERGLLLTCMWYIRELDPQTLLMTGLTRDGVYLIEDGEVQGVVNNFRFNESPIDLLDRTTEIGVSVDTLPREWADYFTLARMPALRIPDFNMSSISPAS